MKVGFRCALCLVNRAYNQIMRATDDKEKRFRALSEVMEMLGQEFGLDAVPSLIGTKRDRMIKKITENPDPYRQLKESSNRAALAILPQVESLVDSQSTSFEKLKLACKAACLGNIIEYDLLDRQISIEEQMELLGKEEFHIDDTRSFFRLPIGEKEVLYLTDNAGEIAFDTLLVRELGRIGYRVTVVTKGGPALNDALIEDALNVGMDKVADQVMTTGTDAIGVNPEESSEEFVDKFRTCELLVSKGMANWETLTDIGTPCYTLFLLRVKCEPVAESLGTPMEKNIAKLVPKGFRL